MKSYGQRLLDRVDKAEAEARRHQFERDAWALKLVRYREFLQRAHRHLPPELFREAQALLLHTPQEDLPSLPEGEWRLKD